MPGIQHVLINPFLIATRGSAPRAATLGNYADNALNGSDKPAAIIALYAAYHPVWETFKTAFAGRLTKQGSKRSNVYAVQQALEQLSEHIKDWALAIETAYRKGTPGYIELLPGGRKPFRNGSKKRRMAALNALALTLTKHPELAALRAEVEAFAANLTALNVAAIGKVSQNKGGSMELERLRLALCTALYAVLGGLINLYPDNPERVAAYFDVATLHRHHRRKRKETVEAEASHNEQLPQQEGGGA